VATRTPHSAIPVSRSKGDPAGTSVGGEARSQRHVEGSDPDRATSADERARSCRRSPVTRVAGFPSG
jgi:hypothetical protein